MKRLFLTILLITSLAHAAPYTEAQVAAYRQTMSQAKQDLQNGNSSAAFAKIKNLAEQGFAEAQYILGTLYHDGEGV